MELTKEQSRRLQQLIDKCNKHGDDVDIYEVMNTYKCYLSADDEVRNYVYSVVIAGLFGVNIDADKDNIDKVIDTILEEHTKVLDTDETIMKDYRVNIAIQLEDDIEISVHHNKDHVTIYAYSYPKGRHISLKENFKRLYSGLKKVAKDRCIDKDKGYRYSLTLVGATASTIECIEPTIANNTNTTTTNAEPSPTIDTVLDIEGVARIIEGNKVLIDQVEELKVYIYKLENENKELNNKIHKLVNENNELIIKSKSGGRPPKFSDADVETIRMYRMQGEKIKDIANLYKCSVGLIHKIVNFT